MAHIELEFAPREEEGRSFAHRQEQPGDFARRADEVLSFFFRPKDSPRQFPGTVSRGNIGSVPLPSVCFQLEVAPSTAGQNRVPWITLCGSLHSGSTNSPLITSLAQHLSRGCSGKPNQRIGFCNAPVPEQCSSIFFGILMSKGRSAWFLASNRVEESNRLLYAFGLDRIVGRAIVWDLYAGATNGFNPCAIGPQLYIPQEGTRRHGRPSHSVGGMKNAQRDNSNHAKP